MTGYKTENYQISNNRQYIINGKEHTLPKNVLFKKYKNYYVITVCIPTKITKMFGIRRYGFDRGIKKALHYLENPLEYSSESRKINKPTIIYKIKKKGFKCLDIDGEVVILPKNIAFDNAQGYPKFIYRKTGRKTKHFYFSSIHWKYALERAKKWLEKQN